MILRGKVTFRSLADRAKADVNKMAGKVRDPDGDVEPRLYLYRPSSPALHVLEVPREAFASRQSKDVLASSAIPMMVEIGGVTLVALQTTMYQSQHDFGALSDEEQRNMTEHYDRPDWMPAPSQDPNRIEFVGVLVFDAEVREMWMREITRAPSRRPRFGSWRQAPAITWGKLIDPIAEALR